VLAGAGVVLLAVAPKWTERVTRKFGWLDVQVSGRVASIGWSGSF